MKRFIFIATGFVLAIFLSACGYPLNNGSFQHEHQSKITATLNPTAEPTSESIQNPVISMLHGQWENTERNWYEFIFNDSEVTFVEYYDNKKSIINKTVAFKLSVDEKDIIILAADKPKYILELSESGILSAHDLDKDKYDTYKKISDTVSIPDVAKPPIIGMTQDEVLMSTWGSPYKRNKTTSASGIREQWEYKGVNHNKYIYFENGYVVTIQE